MVECHICPRKCKVNRLAGEKGFCGAGALPKVARAALHHWEEPCISGTRGSGTVFFSHCNLRCVFCQNFKISHGGFGAEVGIEDLASIFLRLQEEGAHNINLVSATQYIPQVAASLALAREEGLSIPVVYNTNAYEDVETLSILNGLVDVYLPDLKYFHDAPAARYSGAVGYFAHASRAILEMSRQVGPPVFDADGMIRRGLIIRHLVLPGMSGEGKLVLDWIRATLPEDVYISLMWQYVPMHRAADYPEISRRVTQAEYDEVVDHAIAIGLDNGYIQEDTAADESFVPPFDLTGVAGHPDGVVDPSRRETRVMHTRSNGRAQWESEMPFAGWQDQAGRP
ncbi:MAG TPA: radical SAM protein [Firmicutes bacterium]|nr:radical SAM protein [Bacillota bacterium]